VSYSTETQFLLIDDGLCFRNPLGQLRWVQFKKGGSVQVSPVCVGIGRVRQGGRERAHTKSSEPKNYPFLSEMSTTFVITALPSGVIGPA
jgi:hypothetical protein